MSDDPVLDERLKSAGAQPLPQNPTSALTKCPACSNDVSVMAAACPKCGHPLKADAVTAIQLTNKKWKKLYLVAVAMGILGFYLVLSGLGSHSGGSVGLGFTLIFFSIPISLISRVGAWWTNG